MPEFKWVIDNTDYQRLRLLRASAEAVKRYYNGFKHNKHNTRGSMYNDELNDLRVVYTETLKKIHDETTEALDDLIVSMKVFLNAYSEGETINEKLDVLLAKMDSRSNKDQRRCNNECGDDNE